MRPRVAIIYNQPLPDRYEAIGEKEAVLGVLGEVDAVHRALSESGYTVTRVPLVPPLERVREQLGRLDADVMFNLFEGFDGDPQTEAHVAGMLSEMGLRHTGCGADAIASALDKAKARSLLAAAGVESPQHQLLNGEGISSFVLGFPCIVKPNAEDASHGITEESVVDDLSSLERQVARVCDRYGGWALVEEYIDGREFNATVLGNTRLEVLPVSEIAYSLPPGMPRILTYSAKWEPESTYYRCSEVVCPAELETEERERIESVVVTAFRALGCTGYARVDLRMDAGGHFKVIEVNPNPDISPDAGAARQARAAGMTYRELIERIVILALDGAER